MDFIIEDDDQFQKFITSIESNRDSDKKIYLPKFKNLKHLQQAIGEIGIDKIASLDLRELVADKEQLPEALGIKLDSQDPFLFNLITSPHLRHLFLALKDDLIVVYDANLLFEKLQLLKIKIADLVIEKSQSGRDKLMMGNILAAFPDLIYLKYTDSESLGLVDVEAEAGKAHTRNPLRFTFIDGKGTQTEKDLIFFIPKKEQTQLDFYAFDMDHTGVYALRVTLVVDPESAFACGSSGYDSVDYPDMIPDDGMGIRRFSYGFLLRINTTMPPQSEYVSELILNMENDYDYTDRGEHRVVDKAIDVMHKLYFGDLTQDPRAQDVKTRVGAEEKRIELADINHNQQKLTDLFPNCFITIKVRGQNPEDVPNMNNAAKNKIAEIEAKYILRHLRKNPQLAISDKIAEAMISKADKVSVNHPEMANEIKHLIGLCEQKISEEESGLYHFHYHDTMQPRSSKRSIDQVTNVQQGRADSPSASPRSPRSPSLGDQASLGFG